MVLKLAANLILNPTSLSAQLVSSKYQFFGSWNSYRKPQKFSPIWNKICAQSNKIQYQFMWMVANGQSINAWNDPWITNIPLGHWPAFTDVSSDLAHRRVADFITPDHRWDHVQLSWVFNADMMSMILSLPLPQGQWSDQLVWASSRSQQVTVKDYAHLICTRRTSFVSKDFSWIWKLCIPMRTKYFCWKLQWSRLPCKKFLSSRGILSLGSSPCDLCPDLQEDCQHSLVTCSFADKCWASLAASVTNFKPHAPVVAVPCKWFAKDGDQSGDSIFGFSDLEY